MEIREYRAFNRDEIFHLYDSVGWISYTSHMDRLERGYQHSLYTLGAYVEGALVGIIRTVGDGHTVVFVQDLLVLPEYQRRGIGKALLQRVLERFDDVYQVELLTDDTPGTKAFYESLGLRDGSAYGCIPFVRYRV